MAQVKLLMVLTENDAIVPPRDLAGLIEVAVEAEAHGIDGVMLSEHVLMGPSAGANGVMSNLRDYAAPGNQSPATAWPSSIVMLSAIAQVTTRLRLVAGAIIAPLRHPLLLAKELGTLDLLSQGRLVVLPTVSWHRDEYEALGVDFRRRGAILDEQLEVLAKAWGPYPISHEGPRFGFGEVWLEPGAHTQAGPRMWFGGSSMHPALAQRIARYGHGLNPFGPLTQADLDTLGAAMAAQGRDLAELELIGGIRGTFDGPDAIADLDQALATLPDQLAQGYTTICFKPAMFVREVADLPAFYDELTSKVEAIARQV
ncbi:MAG: LLM class flavin-dependent oxidoreductase [Actinomycetales bacterium]